MGNTYRHALLWFLHFFTFILFRVCECFVYTYVYAPCVYSACGDPRRVLDPLGLEFQTVVGTGN